MYKIFIKPILFLFAPEQAHHLTLRLLKIMLAVPGISPFFKSLCLAKDEKLQRKFLGLDFPNPVGLAAGFDKDGQHFEAMAALGFGFIELGTVTPKPQIGNAQPRMFRLPKDEALINRMGFNNEGVEALVERLKNRKNKDLIIGGNIGKNKVTPNEDAINDYSFCFTKLFPYVDYFVVNVSSPNTPGLRALQDKEPLSKILLHLQELNGKEKNQKPILLKIAPDLTNEQLNDIIEIVEQTKIDGVIATNTTISRDNLHENKKNIKKIGMGGLSGRPLAQRSTEVIRYLKEHSKGKMFIIGVGGIRSSEDANEKLKAGADLIQLYSGLVYEGPLLVKRINKSIANQPSI